MRLCLAVGGAEDRTSGTLYAGAPELTEEARTVRAGYRALPLLCGSLRHAPLAGAAPSHSGSISPSSRFMNCPIGVIRPPARRAARLVQLVPTPRRTGPRFHRPAKFQSMSTARAVTRLVPMMMGIVEVAALATSLARQRTVGVCQRAG
jgi:hypothetical protein